MRSYLGYLLILLIYWAPAQANTHRPQDFLQKISGSKDEGEQIYAHYCANCHALKPLIPLGAPRIGVLEDWQVRLKQGAEQLIKHSDEGLNAMPPRGGCFECTDKQLLLAIIILLPKKLKNDVFNELRDHKKNS